MQVTTEGINQAIKNAKERGFEAGGISDGFHTFDELYEHRIQLFIALARHYASHPRNKVEVNVWKTHVHSDGGVWEGWFILGMFQETGKQITYHLPEHLWGQCNFAQSLAKAPEWDGHSAEDVIQRLKELI